MRFLTQKVSNSRNGNTYNKAFFDVFFQLRDDFFSTFIESTNIRAVYNATTRTLTPNKLHFSPTLPQLHLIPGKDVLAELLAPEIYAQSNICRYSPTGKILVKSEKMYAYTGIVEQLGGISAYFQGKDYDEWLPDDMKGKNPLFPNAGGAQI
jgi:hypothetical protein